MDQADWDKLMELGAQLPPEGALPLSDELRALLERTAPDAALGAADIQSALSSSSSATVLFREVHRRIREGSRRLSRALVSASKLKQAGDLASARTVLEAAAKEEVVPLYLEQLQIALDHLDDPEDDA
jgi:DUSAM domain-containing protein